MGGSSSKTAAAADTQTKQQKVAAAAAAAQAASLAANVPDPNALLSAGEEQENPIDKKIIERAHKVPQQAVGASERTLTLALAALTLLDDPTTLSDAPPSFTETFKWCVLSHLRVCSICKKKHCPESRQAMITPPIRFTGGAEAAASGETSNRFAESFVDPISVPAMRYICDDCNASLFVERYVATAKEFAVTEARTLGFSGGSTHFELLDGPAECLYHHTTGEPLRGITQIQHGTAEEKQQQLVKPNQKQKQQQQQQKRKLCINAMTLGGPNLSDDIFFEILRNNSDLKRLEINVFEGSATCTPQHGTWKNSVISPLAGAQCLEELTVRMRPTMPSDVKKCVLPLVAFSNLRSLTVHGFCMTECDMGELLVAAARKNALPPLRRVIIIGQQKSTPLRLDNCLRTLGQLPLELLSCAFMEGVNSLDIPPEFRRFGETTHQQQQRTQRNQDDDDDGDEGVVDCDSRTKTVSSMEAGWSLARANVAETGLDNRLNYAPILVSSLNLHGTPATTTTVSNIMLRCRFLSMIDLSETGTCIVTALDAASISNLASLRVVRANNVTGVTRSNGTSNLFATKVESWENLVSLSQMQMQNLRHNEGRPFTKFGTLPSLTALDVSFGSSSGDVAANQFIPVLSDMRSLLKLTIRVTDSNNRYGIAPSAASTMAARASPKLVMRSLRTLTVAGSIHPAFQFGFDGCPRLEALVIQSRVAEKLPEGPVIELINSIGRSVSRFDLNCIPHTYGSASTTADSSARAQFCIGFGTAMPNLAQLTIRDDSWLKITTTQSLQGCLQLRELHLDSLSLPQERLSGHEKFFLEQALKQSGAANLIVLTLSDAAHFWGFLSPTVSDSTALVLPALRRFDYRKTNGDRAATTVGVKHKYVGDLFLWLSLQPVLEEIDVEGAIFAPNSDGPVDLQVAKTKGTCSFSRFWFSPCMQNSVTYLNFAFVRVSPTQSVVGRSSALPMDFLARQTPSTELWRSKPQPQKLKVIRFSVDAKPTTVQSAFQMNLQNLPSLRCVWVSCGASLESPMPADVTGDWAMALERHGVQVNTPKI